LIIFIYCPLLAADGRVEAEQISMEAFLSDSVETAEEEHICYLSTTVADWLVG
jgi:hypothetical protein